MDSLGLTRMQTQRLVREYLDKGRHMEAMVVAKKGIKEFAHGFEFRLLLAEVYEAQGDLAKAAEQLEQVLAAVPENESARAAQARLRGRR